MADHEVGGLYPIDLGRMDMMTALGFVGSDVDDDEDSGKAIWDDLASEIGGGAATVDTPATDVSDERTSTLDEKVPIEVADMHFSQDIQSKAEIQPACGTLKEQPSKAVYGSCISGQMFGLRDSQYTLAKPSSSERFYNDKFSDAIGSNHLKLHRQISQEMQIACDIVEEPSHIALYGSKNPYELTGLGNPHDKIIAPSFFEGVNISSISSTSSGMNLSTNNAKENNEYNQLKLQKQIDGYQRFEIGSGLNMDDADGDLTATGVPTKVQMELFSPSSSRITSTDVISGALPKINLQGGTMMGKYDLKHKNLHGQIGFHENVASHYFGMNPELPRISSLLHQKCSEFLQLNSDAMRCLIRVEIQVEQSTIIGPPYPSVTVPSPLSGNHLSSMSRGYCLGNKDPNNQGIGFSPMYEPSGFNTNYTLPLRMEAHAMESYDIDALSKATRQSCQQQPQRQQYRHLERHHKKIVASEAHALHGNVETPIRMNKAKEFNEIVRDHEACFLSFYHPTPIPSHVLNMLHLCFGIDMERKMPLPKRYPTQCYGTPRSSSNLRWIDGRHSGRVVVEHILQHGKALVRSLIINRFIGKIVTMSKQKYASNVIEKSLVFGSYDETQKIINEVLTMADLIKSGETEVLMVLVNDQYANYVVQKVIVTCDEWQRKIPEDAPQTAPQLHLCKACRCTDREAH
uniref:PUM-HD domain-containing protein n=1 Tax=Oryza glumipatula TaxID=40148 RepID=A0A0D9ZXI3_9ORYZ